MKRITIATVLCLVAALQTAYSQQKKQEQTQLATLQGVFCKVDVANKTFRVLPWDRTTKTWKRDAIRVLAWNDHTQLRSGGTTLTMPQFDRWQAAF